MFSSLPSKLLNGSLGHSLKRVVARLTRQVHLPGVTAAGIEISLFSSVFLVAGRISLGLQVSEMVPVMIPVVLVIMLCMVASGVYQPRTMLSIVKLYKHSVYGFVLAALSFLVLLNVLAPEYVTMKFAFFFLFFSFFVIHTIRPLMRGTDFMDGGGRRAN